MAAWTGLEAASQTPGAMTKRSFRSATVGTIKLHSTCSAHGEHWQIDPNSLKPRPDDMAAIYPNRIGEGGFGIVYKGFLSF